jgi:hypothetical protein
VGRKKKFGDYERAGERLMHKILDVAKTMLANDLVALGSFALLTMPIESLMEKQPGQGHPPVAALRNVLIGAIAVRAASPAIPAIASIAEKAVIGIGQGKKGLALPEVPYFG